MYRFDIDRVQVTTSSFRVKELKAEGGAKGVAQGQDVSVAQEEYMDDVEGYGEEELEANVYDDDYLSSEGENVADVTIDLLEDEEFPDLLDQEEMDHHALAMTTYDHEVEDTSSKRSAGRAGFGNQGAPSHSQQLQQQSPRQSASSRHMLQQQQQQDSDADRTRGSPFAKSKREWDPQQASKSRKPEGLSRLPMPRNFQSSTPSSSTSIPGPQHRHLQSGASGRNNSTTSNSSPPLAAKSREPKPSPSDMSISPGGPSDYLSQKGSSNINGVSPIAIKHPSNSTKQHQHSSSTSSNRNGPASAGPVTPGGHDPNNYPMASPPTSSPMSTSEGRPLMQAEMDAFIQDHQAQMRDCAELTKRETKLLAQVTLGMSSTVHAQSTGFSNNRESFMKYLSDLDEIVDEKLITIVAMSQKLKALRGQM